MILGSGTDRTGARCKPLQVPNPVRGYPLRTTEAPKPCCYSAAGPVTLVLPVIPGCSASSEAPRVAARRNLDAFAQAHPLAPEVEKPASQRGLLSPPGHPKRALAPAPMLVVY